MNPKRDQNLQFTPLSETSSIPVTFIWESPTPRVEELQKARASPKWGANTEEKLDQAKRYLKTDYKVHCKEESSPCVDHCRVFALSDANYEAFKQDCEHWHNLQCDMCENLKSVVHEIEVLVRMKTRLYPFTARNNKKTSFMAFSKQRIIYLTGKHILCDRKTKI